MLENFRTQKIIWDRANKKIFEKIEANSGDSNGRKLVVQVINQGVTEGLSGTTLSLGWKSREGAKGLDAFNVVDTSKGIFEIYYTTEMLSNIGNIEASLILIDSTSRIESSAFTISVRPSTVDDESVESENSFTALTEALVKVNDLEDNYAPRLNEVTAQLAQTEKRIPNLANATAVLDLINPYGNDQNIHPKVLYFPTELFGYKYWMAYTPYPNGDVKKENPCIAASQNGVDWEVPSGMSSALLEDWNGIANDYNNDTHLVYRADINRLEVWFRTAYANGGAELKRRTTSDGITWSPTEIMFTGNRSGNDHLSPAILFENNKYKMLSTNSESSTRTLNYTESSDGKIWEPRTRVEVDFGTLTPWHQDVIKTESGYEMVLQAWDVGETNNTSSLYYLTSPDLMSWTKPIKILSPSLDGFDNAGIYRSSILKINETYIVYYSSISKSGTRAIAISSGETIFALKGYQPNLSGGIKKISLITGGVGASFEADKNIVNKIDVKQSSNPERFGHLKVGSLYFADGRTSNTIGDESAIRYNPARRAHERFNGSVWAGVNTRVWAKASSSTQLIKNEWVDMYFGTIIYNDAGKFNGTSYSVAAGGEENILLNLGLNIIGLSAGDALEIAVRNQNNVTVQLIYRSGVALLDGGQSINARVPFSSNASFKVSIKYTGNGSPSTTSYPTQNFLYIEAM